MRIIFLLSLIGLLTHSATPAHATDDEKPPTRAPSLDGSWLVDSIRFQEYELRSNSEKPMRISFEEDRATFQPRINISDRLNFSITPQGTTFDRTLSLELSVYPRTMTFKTDQGHDPAHIDLYEQVENKTVVRRGIYRAVDKSIEICLRRPEADRPLAFQSKDAMLLMLKRPPRGNPPAE